MDDHVARIEDSAAYFYCDHGLETVAGLTDTVGDGVPYHQYDAAGEVTFIAF